MLKTPSSDATAKALLDAVSVATEKATGATSVAVDARSKAGAARTVSDTSAALLKRLEMALSKHVTELKLATTEHDNATKAKATKVLKAKEPDLKIRVDDATAAERAARVKRDDAKIIADKQTEEATRLAAKADEEEQAQFDAEEAQELATKKAGGVAPPAPVLDSAAVSQDRLNALKAKDAEILAREAEIVELKSKLAGGPGTQAAKDALGNFFEMFSENLQEGAGVEGRSGAFSVNELTKVQARKLPEPKVKYFNELRSLSRSNTSQDIFGTQAFKDWLGRRCVEVQYGSAWMWPIVTFLESNPVQRDLMNLLVAWANSFAVKNVLPIGEGMAAVRSLLSLLAAIYTRWFSEAHSIELTLLDLSLDAQLRFVPPETIVQHDGELKTISGRHPVKALMESVGQKFPEQKPPLIPVVDTQQVTHTADSAVMFLVRKVGFHKYKNVWFSNRAETKRHKFFGFFFKFFFTQN